MQTIEYSFLVTTWDVCKILVYRYFQETSRCIINERKISLLVKMLKASKKDNSDS